MDGVIGTRLIRASSSRWSDVRKLMISRIKRDRSAGIRMLRNLIGRQQSGAYAPGHKARGRANVIFGLRRIAIVNRVDEVEAGPPSIEANRSDGPSNRLHTQRKWATCVLVLRPPEPGRDGCAYARRRSRPLRRSPSRRRGAARCHAASDSAISAQNTTPSVHTSHGARTRNGRAKARTRVAQHQHADADHGEGDQRADRYQLARAI